MKVRLGELKMSRNFIIGRIVFYFAPCLLLVPLSNAASVSTMDNNSHWNSNDSNKTLNYGHNADGHGIQVAHLNFSNIREPLVFTIVVIFAAICKVAFHHTNYLSSKVPESCLLIIMGLLCGAIVEFSGAAYHLPDFFSPHDFFQFLLPPIILEASYSLHDRTFADNIGSILLFAVVGTLLAFSTLGFTLYGLAISGAMGEFPFEITLTQVLIFAALIVAVDPVAVLAVFHEVGVNNVLYFLVFGESLLNDGVTVVLYQVMQSYDELSSSGESVGGDQIGLGIIKFLVVCLGGLGLGILAGVLTAFLTKYTRHVKVVQPILIYTMAYLGFLLAELFEFSGIISIIGCGLTQVQYAFHNISDKSRTSVFYFTKVISTTNEIIIFLFLGLAMVRKRSHMWHTGFVLWSVLFCLVYRFIITFFLTFLVNTLDKARNRKIGYDEQFMIAYGGLRGAVCFSLVALLDEDKLPSGMKDMFETTTLVVIFFTVFVQGISIKPLVKLLRVQLAPSKELSLNADLNENMTDHLVAGIEEIVGLHGRYTLKEEFGNFEDRYIKRWLQLEPETSHTQLQEFYNKIILKEHFKHLELAGAKVNPGRSRIPRIETRMYLFKEDEKEHVPHGHLTEPEVRQKKKHKPLHIDYNGLRSLLKSHHGPCILHRKWDKNLTGEHLGNLANHIQSKTARNRRIEKLLKEANRQKEEAEEKTEAEEEHEHINGIETGTANGTATKTGSDSQEYINPMFEGDHYVVHF